MDDDKSTLRFSDEHLFSNTGGEAVTMETSCQSDNATAKTYDTSCGIGHCRPKWLQKFARISVFVGFYSASGMLTATIVLYVNSQIPMLEKQFGFSSKESGLLMAFNDIGFLCTAIFLGHLAKKVHIPRGLCISTFLYGICGILCALPYFMQDKSVYILDKDTSGNINNSEMSQTAMSRRVPMCIGQNASDMTNFSACAGNSLNKADAQELSIKKAAFILIGLGLIVQGIGKSPRYPFVTLYVDDSVDKTKTGFYMGIIYCVVIFGPALAFGLGGLFSKIYVTLEDVDIDIRDPRWIGAWWLGFIVFGAIAILTSLPLFFFPYRLKQKATEQFVEDKPTKSKMFLELKEFIQSLFRVVRNPVYSLSLLGSCLSIVTGAGTFTFMSKYIVTQFSVPLWKANIILALSTIIAFAMGSFVGGVITRKVKMTPSNTLKLMLTYLTVNIGLNIVGYFLGCGQPDLYGMNAKSSSLNLYQRSGLNSSSSCVCKDESYFPICGVDGRSYFSPCHAGCQTRNLMRFFNCSEIPGGEAIAGLCEQKCNTLYPWAAVNFVAALIGAFQIAPGFLFTIRCVEERDRAMATALASFATSAFGWMPGPVIFGTVIDNACLLWKYICAARQSCFLYDLKYFRVAMYSFGLVGKLVSAVFTFAIFIMVRNKDWTEVAQRKRRPVNGVKTLIVQSAKIFVPMKHPAK